MTVTDKDAHKETYSENGQKEVFCSANLCLNCEDGDLQAESAPRLSKRRVDSESLCDVILHEIRGVRRQRE